MLESASSTPGPSEKSPTGDAPTASVDVTEHPVAVDDKQPPPPPPPPDAAADEDSTGTPCDTKPATSATVATDITVPSAQGSAAAEVASVPGGDVAGVGTSSQDEEEGVSDVESEKSQEPSVKTAADISDLAARLLDSWKDLKVQGCQGHATQHHPHKTSLFSRRNMHLLTTF